MFDLVGYVLVDAPRMMLAMIGLGWHEATVAREWLQVMIFSRPND